MARARPRSIAPARSGGPPRPALGRRLRRWLGRELPSLQPAIAAGAQQVRADRYRKHFDALTHAALLLFHGLTRSPSLRQTHECLADAPELLEAFGLAPPADGAVPVSRGQFTDSNTTRPAAFLAEVVARLAARVARTGPRRALPYPLELCVVDATFLRLSVRLATWLPRPRGTEPSGVRLQVQYRPALDLPEHVVVTASRRKDTVGLDDLLLGDPTRRAALAGQTLVLDLGYYSHARFAQVLAVGGHLVTRRQAQATLVVEAEQAIQPPLPGLDGGRIAVETDARVTVGTPSNRRGAVLSGWRLVTATVAPTAAARRHGTAPVRYQLLTDRWDLSAAEVVQLYLWRWQIELFFKWLKHQVSLLRQLGTSDNAVELTVWLSLAVHLLTLLAAQALDLPRRSPALRARLQQAVLLLRLDPPPRPAVQLPFPDPLDAADRPP